MPAEFVAPEVKRDIAGAAAQPARQRGVLGEAWGQGPRPARQTDEDALGNLGGHVRRIHLPQGGGIDEVRVPGDDFGERRFDAVFGVFAKKLCVGPGLHLTY